MTYRLFQRQRGVLNDLDWRHLQQGQGYSPQLHGYPHEA